MEISYIREAGRNYMVMAAAQADGYQLRMLADNRVAGLLRVCLRYEDGEMLCCYDITSRQPLNRLLESRMITAAEIRGFLMQLRGTLERMRAYLLGDEGIVLEAEYIYVEPETLEPAFCLVPGYGGEFQERLSRLLQIFLRHIDHRDRECVVLAYGLYQESLKENCGLDDLLRLAGGEGRRAWGSDGLDGQNPGAGSRGESRPGAGNPGESRPGAGSLGGGSRASPGTEEQGRSAGIGPDGTAFAAHETERDEKRRLLWQAGFWGLTVLLLPSAIWLFYGRGALLRCWRLLAAGDAALLALLAAGNGLAVLWRRRKGSKAKPKAEDPWQIFYEDEEERAEEEGRLSCGQEAQEEAEAAFERMKARLREQKPPEQKPSELFQTTLLNRGEPKQGHRLLAMSAGAEDIVVAYSPFLIGKHPDLADFVLNHDTVSRLHLRCELAEEGCRITDLNSTNGTRIRGTLLAANETAEVQEGDEIMIADLRYIWQ